MGHYPRVGGVSGDRGVGVCETQSGRTIVKVDSHYMGPQGRPRADRGRVLGQLPVAGCTDMISGSSLRTPRRDDPDSWVTPLPDSQLRYTVVDRRAGQRVLPRDDTEVPVR